MAVPLLAGNAHLLLPQHLLMTPDSTLFPLVLGSPTYLYPVQLSTSQVFFFIKPIKEIHIHSVQKDGCKGAEDWESSTELSVLSGYRWFLHAVSFFSQSIHLVLPHCQHISTFSLVVSHCPSPALCQGQKKWLFLVGTPRAHPRHRHPTLTVDFMFCHSNLYVSTWNIT